MSATSTNSHRPDGRDWKGGTSVKTLAQGYGADALIDLKNGLHRGKISAEFAGEFFGAPSEVSSAGYASMRQYFQKQHQAEQAAQLVQGINQVAVASKVAQRSPEDFAAFAQAVAEENDSGTFYIDANVLLQTGIAEQVAQLSPAVAAQLQEAAQTGGQIAIPAGEYAAQLARSEYANQLTDHIKVEPDAWSKAEAREWMQSGEGSALQREMDYLLRDKQADATFRASSDAVRDIIKGQLSAAGRFTQQANDSYAALTSSFYAVQAAKMGMTPEELYRQYPLQVTAEGLGPQVLARESYSQQDLTPTEEVGNAWRQALEKIGGAPIDHAMKLPTPAVLKSMGLKKAALDAPKRVLQQIAAKHQDVPLDVLQRLPELLHDPVYVYRHQNGGWRVVLDAATEKGEPIVVGVNDGRLRTITPIHDRDGVTGQQVVAQTVAALYRTHGEKLYARNVEALRSLGAEGFYTEGYRHNRVDPDARGKASVTGPRRLVNQFGENYYQSAAEASFRAPEVRNEQGELLAPNGEPSRLTEGQWHQVRSPQFKAWFGDWEHDPENASKVVDENGEPLVVYHGTAHDTFYVFEHGNEGYDEAESDGFFFTDNLEAAEEYGANGGRVVDVFLNIKDPFDFKDRGQIDSLNDAIENDDVNSPVYGEKPPAFNAGENAWNTIVDNTHRLAHNDVMNGVLNWINESSYDGVFMSDSMRDVPEYQSFVAFNANQIKSATGNSGAFDSENPNILYQSAWHGTPHRGIEQTGFKLNKIGTGEGAQAYGWGMYFASRRGVAESYRETLGARNAPPEVSDLVLRRNAIRGDVDAQRRKIERGGQWERRRADGTLWGVSITQKPVEDGWVFKEDSASQKRYARSKLKKLEAELAQVEERLAEVSSLIGQLYQVEIPEDDDLLDYDKPLSEQPQKVRDAIEAIRRGLPREMGWIFDGVDGSVQGKQLYGLMGEVAAELNPDGVDNIQQAASELLLEHGVPGLRYLDGMSRNAGEGSHNYVIWDEALLTPEAAQIRAYYQRSQHTKAAYEARIDELFAGEKPSLEGVRVLDGSDMLGLLGMGDGPVYLAEGKVRTEKHPNMGADVWKKIPQWLDNPAAVFDSDTVQGRLVAVAPETINGNAVLMVLEPYGQTKADGVRVHLLQNAYDKDESVPPFGRWLREGKGRYVDQKKFPVILHASGLQLSGTAWQNKPGMLKILTEKNLAGYRKERGDVLFARQQQQPNVPRGFFDPGSNTIGLLKDADLSTYLHEAGHFFLEMQVDLASRVQQEACLFGADTNTEGQAQIAKDMQILLDWFGVRDLAELFD